MSGTRLSDVDRREFLGRSALAILAGSCFASVAGFRAALAMAASKASRCSPRRTSMRSSKPHGPGESPGAPKA